MVEPEKIEIKRIETRNSSILKFNIKLKCLLLGDSSVGKSCIFLRITENNYTENHLSTVGVDFQMLYLIINKENVGFQVWDTAGQERYLSITNSLFQKMNGFIVIYDVSNRRSFDNVVFWTKQLEEFQQSYKHSTILLFANKTDLSESFHQVSYDEGKELADKLGFLFLEGSAKTGYNINELFNIMAENMYQSFNKFRRNNMLNDGNVITDKFDLNNWNKKQEKQINDKKKCCNKV